MTNPGPERDRTDPPAPEAKARIAGYVALGLAVAFALMVGGYLFFSSGEETEVPALSAQIGTPQANTGPIDPNRPKEGEVAPDFALPDARDPAKLVKLSDFRGTAVVVNFYYSDCAPCKREIPTFVTAATQLGDSVVFLGVDYLEDAEDAVSILDRYEARYPAVLDKSGAVAEHYRVTAFPASFFIDAEGVVRVIKTGEVSPEMLSTFLGKAGVTYSP